MAQHKTNAPKRTPREGRRRRFGRPERSLTAAAWLSAAIVLGVALAIYAVKFAVPTSALHNFLELVFVNRQVSPTSAIYQDLLAQNVSEDTFFTSPFSLFCGGLALPFLAPRTAGRVRILRAAVAVPCAILLVCLCLLWGAMLAVGDGHLPSGVEVTRHLVLTQAAVCLADIAAFVLGAFLGLLWRRANRRRADATSSPPSPAGISAARR